MQSAPRGCQNINITILIDIRTGRIQVDAARSTKGDRITQPGLRFSIKRVPLSLQRIVLAWIFSFMTQKALSSHQVIAAIAIDICQHQSMGI